MVAALIMGGLYGRAFRTSRYVVVVSGFWGHLRQTIWGPVVKATAMIRGVQAGLDFFRTARHRRGPIDHGETSAEQQDEGMFI